MWICSLHATTRTQHPHLTLTLRTRVWTMCALARQMHEAEGGAAQKNVCRFFTWFRPGADVSSSGAAGVAEAPANAIANCELSSECAPRIPLCRGSVP